MGSLQQCKRGTLRLGSPYVLIWIILSDLSFLESSETRKQEKNQIYNIENIENWKQLFYNIEWENQNLKTTVRLERYAVEANPSLKIPIAKNQKDP